jgi:thioredoxin:protein disulfide reductase
MKKITLLLLMVSFLFANTKFLMPNEAFIPSAKLGEDMKIEAKVEIAKDIYLYEEKLKLEIIKGNGVSIKEIRSPKSVSHHDDMVFLESPSFEISLQKDAGVSGMKTIELKISYQGCSEQGLCYEPLDKTFTYEIDTSKLSEASTKGVPKLDLKTKVEDTKQELTQDTKEKLVQETKEVSESDSIANTIGSGNIGLILATFLGFGLLLAMTPCVFPMIPIISGLIVSQGEGITTRKAFALSLVYVLSMAVAYTIAGVLAGLFGQNLQAALQTPWVIYGFSLIFVALAFSMFGFYELKLPDAIVNKVSSSNHRSGYIGVAIMGFLSALIVGPCVAAPLAGALVYIGQTGDAVLGGMALFSLSIGMGLPLIVVGVSAGKFMPKPGAWMTMVTAIFGVMMLGVAIWMLERVVSDSITNALYAMLGLGFAIYLGVFEKESHVFKKSVAVIVFIYSLAIFIGVLAGSSSLTKPLGFLIQSPIIKTAEVTAITHKSFIKVTSIAELDKLLAQNKGKKIMLDFYADWCTACKELEHVTFSNEAVKTKMDEFVLIQADVTLNGEDEKALSSKYGVFGPPALIFFDKDAKVLDSKTLIGFTEPEVFLEHLNKI